MQLIYFLASFKRCSNGIYIADNFTNKQEALAREMSQLAERVFPVKDGVIGLRFVPGIFRKGGFVNGGLQAADNQASAALAHFELKWGSKYRHAVQSWHRNWNDLTAFFDFPVEIRKHTKTKLSFPTDDALRKSVWLAMQEIEKKGTMPIKNWGLVMKQFIAIFREHWLRFGNSSKLDCSHTCTTFENRIGI